MLHVVDITTLLYPDDLFIGYALYTVYGFLVLLFLLSIYSVDTILYPYALPLEFYSLISSQVFA